MKAILFFVLFIIIFKNLLIGQELFYRENQSGGNIGFGFSNNRSSSSSYFNLSYIFSGKFLIFADFEKASSHDYNSPVIKGTSTGGGIGIITRREKLPFHARLLLGYSSIDFKDFEYSFNLYALNFSLFKNLNPDKPVNIVPEVFLTYAILTASENPSIGNTIYASHGFSYGFHINIGYITNTYISPLTGFGIILNSSQATFVLKLSMAFSNFRAIK
jgi:hypothetical protein